jgi:acetyl esterase/lipase
MTHLAIHPDFQAIQARPMSFKPLPLALMNGLIGVVNALKLRNFKHLVRREKIVGSDGHRIPLLIFKPEGLPSPSAALVYYHGGAFVFKHAPPHIDNAVRYAREANCCVIFVDYRLAPKDPFPRGFNDCYDALLWTVANAAKLGIDKRRVAVAGDSAGGTMAAAAAQKAVQENGPKLCGQLLIYPATDSDSKSASITAFANVPPFKELSSSGVWEAYLGHPLAAGVPRYAAPLHGDLSGVAPACVETAEFDPLRDEGRAYAQKLIASGVEVSTNEVKGAVHGFDLLAAGSEVSKRAVEARVQFLRKIFQART